jgi:CheY-like chemotaxis protein
MGGCIGVRSTPGQGSTFFFNLPLATDASPIPLVRSQTIPPFPTPLTPAPQSGPHVLLADDNEINILLGQELLQRLGCRVTTAANGRQALGRLEEAHFELILMDCRMPEMDGYKATAEIRRRNVTLNGQRVPIIALTANAAEGDRQRCLDAGMDDYLTKPFRRRDLERVLARWVSQPITAAELKRE